MTSFRTTLILILTLAAQLCHAHYDPNACQFISRDPLQEAGGINTTAFCKNDPINKVDPLGLLDLPTHVRVVSHAYLYEHKEKLIKSKKYFDSDKFLHSLARGSILPDIVVIKSGKKGVYAENLAAADLAFLQIKEKLADLPVVRKVNEVKKEVRSEVIKKGKKHAPQIYTKARNLRNWWQDEATIAEPILKKAANYNKSANAFYQSHWGTAGWQHGCSVEGMSAKDIQTALVNDTIRLIRLYRHSMVTGDYEQAAFHLGTAMHYLADSYTPSHVWRNKDGSIRMFQSYKEQSPHLHALADKPSINDEVFINIVYRSVIFMRIADDITLYGKQLKAKLIQEFYRINAKQTKAKGSHGKYKPR